MIMNFVRSPYITVHNIKIEVEVEVLTGNGNLVYIAMGHTGQL